MDVGSGGGIIRLDGVPLPYLPYTMEIVEGSTVTLEAVPKFGHVFDGWNGDYIAVDNIAIIQIDCNKQITAAFSIDWLLYGSIGGCLALAIALAVILIIRRRDNPSTEPPPVDSAPKD